MYILRYLEDPDCVRKREDSLYAEYRLLCSGTIFRDVAGDPWRSEAARFLLAPPLLLYAASRPFDEYPLELILGLTVAQVKETSEDRSGVPTTALFHPDAEVAQDLAALLTVLCRRLVTVSGKASERYASYPYPRFDHVPLPLATSMRRIFWPPHPATVTTSFAGQTIMNYNPSPKAVDPDALARLLLGLPRLEHAESIVASARLYALALELIREQPAISYQLLISSAETIANEVLRTFQPDDDAKVQHQKAVFNLAVDLGLARETAQQLAVTACKNEHWATRKFDS